MAVGCDPIMSWSREGRPGCLIREHFDALEKERRWAGFVRCLAILRGGQLLVF